MLSDNSRAHMSKIASGAVMPIPLAPLATYQLGFLARLSVAMEPIRTTAQYPQVQPTPSRSLAAIQILKIKRNPLRAVSVGADRRPH